MKIEQIRNATIKVNYSGVCFLFDPWLVAKGVNGSFKDLGFTLADSSKETIKMPMCELPVPREEVLDGVDAYIITHIHPDHLDIDMEGKIAPWFDRDTLTLVQSTQDSELLKANNFTNVEVLSEKGIKVGSVTLYKTPGQHGTITPCGPSCGVVLTSPDEKTLYVAGDTIWFEGVAESIRKYAPEVIITNNCAAHFVENGNLIMDVQDLEKVCKEAPEATVIASHMDTVPHATLTRTSLKKGLKDLGIEGVLIPEDGETIELK